MNFLKFIAIAILFSPGFSFATQDYSNCHTLFSPPVLSETQARERRLLGAVTVSVPDEEFIPPAFTKERFEWARAKLKESSVGLEDQIDETFSQIETWYLYPESRKVPTLILLPGPTGTGKTDIGSTRIMSLLGLTDVVYAKMDEYTNDSNQVGNFEKALREKYSRKQTVDGFQLDRLVRPDHPVFILDDFHNAATLTEDGRRVGRASVAAIFKLMSMGTIELYNSAHSMLKHLKEEYVYYWDNILAFYKYGLSHPDYSSKDYETLDKSAVDRSELSRARVKWLNAIDKLLQSEPEKVQADFRHALIFITVNLNDVFVGSKTVDPDEWTPDDLRHRILQTTRTDLVNGLMKLFSPEEVFRVIGQYVVFPPLSEKMFKQVIANQLQEIQNYAFTSKQISIEFSARFTERIYNECVYPTQGYRPFIRCVNQFIRNPLGPIFAKQASHRDSAHSEPIKIFVDTVSEDIFSSSWSYVNGIHENQRFSIPAEYAISNSPRDEPARSLVALRLAARLIVGIDYWKTLPDQIKTRLRFSQADGLIRYPRNKPRPMGISNEHEKDKFLTPATTNDLRAELAHSIAAFVVEQMVAKQNTDWSSADLQNANNIAFAMVMSLGMGSRKYETTNLITHPSLAAEVKDRKELADQLIREAVEVVECLLQREKDFFKAIAALMRAKVEISHMEISEIFVKTWSDKQFVDEVLEGARVPSAFESFFEDEIGRQLYPFTKTSEKNNGIL